MSPDAVKPSPLVIAASFAVEPALDALAFWANKLRLPLTAELAPYAQTLQQLIDPASPLRRASVRVIAIRWSDLGGGRSPMAAADEFGDALGVAAGDGAPTLILVCPDRGDDGRGREALAARIAGDRSITIIDIAASFAAFDVRDPFDARADGAAHVPYTAEAAAVIGAEIARWRSLALRPPVKMIAVDGDGTLWSGVLGEDGRDGVACPPPRRRLQEALVEASRNGQVVAVLSKNEDEDVARLLESRADFALSPEHLLARRVNWRPKPENLAGLAAEFAVADESILFLDDSPVECAAMRAERPQVLTVRAPEEERLGAFLRHLWLLDRAGPTDADEARLASHRSEHERRAARATAPTLAEFFARLELEVTIADASPADYQRLAQLSQRTNQFNATLKRQDERDFRAGSRAFAVSVRDRFGDYGLVGCMRAAAVADRLETDLFMLSCRALGRGVEHRMVARLGELARDRGLASVAIAYATGPRNAPALRFLADLSGAALARAGAVSIPAAAAAALIFDPAAASPAGGEPAEDYASIDAGGAASGAVYEWIATEMTTASAIVAAMSAGKRARGDLAAAYATPAPGLQSDIAAIWEQAIGVAPIGANDPFGELGGKSIHLVAIHGLIADRLGLEIDLATLFRFGTIAALARHLDAGSDRRASDRGALMRNARVARAERARGQGRARP